MIFKFDRFPSTLGIYRMVMQLPTSLPAAQAQAALATMPHIFGGMIAKSPIKMGLPFVTTETTDGQIVQPAQVGQPNMLFGDYFESNYLYVEQMPTPIWFQFGAFAAYTPSGEIVTNIGCYMYVPQNLGFQEGPLSFTHTGQIVSPAFLDRDSKAKEAVKYVGEVLSIALETLGIRPGMEDVIGVTTTYATTTQQSLQRFHKSVFVMQKKQETGSLLWNVIFFGGLGYGSYRLLKYLFGKKKKRR